MKHWSNWSGGVTARPSAVVGPDGPQALAETIQTATPPLRPVGSGHSFTPICATDGGTQVLLDAFDQVNLDPDGEHVEIGAGIKLGTLTAKLHEMGRALANMGDVDGQAFAGALGTATHGSGLEFTCYSGMLAALTLVDGTGATHRFSREQDADAFRAMAVSIGTGGVLTSARLKSVPAYRLERQRYAAPIDAMLDEWDTRLRAHRNSEFFYIPHSSTAVVLDSDITDGALRARPPENDTAALKQLKLVGKLTGWAPALRRLILKTAIGLQAHEDFCEDWQKVYPSDRDGVRFNECEYHLPFEAGPEALRAIIDIMERDFPEIYFPIEVRCVGADDLSLSPFYKRPSCSIAVHNEAGHPMDRLIAAVEPIFARFDGRPHWGKMHSLTANELRPLYPEWDQAIRIRRELDPEGRFLTPYLRTLLGIA